MRRGIKAVLIGAVCWFAVWGWNAAQAKPCPEVVVTPDGHSPQVIVTPDGLKIPVVLWSPVTGAYMLTVGLTVGAA